MRSLGKIPSAVEIADDLLPRGGMTFERQSFVFVDPVAWDGDRLDVSIVGEGSYLADYEVS